MDSFSELGGKILKVNHAGEHGAVNIYRAQIAVLSWRCPALVPELRGFLSHEERHRKLFSDCLEVRGLSRCRSYVQCGLGGAILGYLTGLLGVSAVSATSVAVESVVLDHLSEQMAKLRNVDLSAYDAVASIIDEEKAHHDHSVLRMKQGTFWPKVVLPVVRVATESVIWLGMKL